MQKRFRLETSIRALCAATVVSLSVGGCSYVEEQIRQLEAAKPIETRQPVRVARSEPNVMRSLPRSAANEAGSGHSDRGHRAAPQVAAPSIAPKAPPGPPAAPETTPPSQTPQQPRLINPSAPPAPPPMPPPPAAAPSSDPLPTHPAQPPPRQDPVPAPPNRANVTPPRQAGGGIASARPPTGEEAPLNRELAALPPARKSTPPPGTPGINGIEIARHLLSNGKVLEARSHLQAAVRVTPALALLELARTYDPFYLGMLPSIDDGSEPRRAAALYQEAILHGSPTAGTDLDRLRQMHPGLR